MKKYKFHYDKLSSPCGYVCSIIGNNIDDVTKKVNALLPVEEGYYNISLINESGVENV